VIDVSSIFRFGEAAYNSNVHICPFCRM